MRLLSTCLLFVLFFACKSDQKDEKKDFYFGYFQNALDLTLPAGTSLAKVHDEKGAWVSGVFTVPKGGVEQLAGQFSKAAKPVQVKGLDKLGSPYQNLPPFEEQLIRQGRSYLAVLDRQQGLLWMEINYREKDQDMSY